MGCFFEGTNYIRIDQFECRSEERHCGRCRRVSTLRCIECMSELLNRFPTRTAAPRESILFEHCDCLFSPFVEVALCCVTDENGDFEDIILIGIAGAKPNPWIDGVAQQDHIAEAGSLGAGGCCGRLEIVQDVPEPAVI